MNIKEFFFGKRTNHSFTSKLSEEDCINRLADELSKYVDHTHLGYVGGRISGKIKGKTFSIWLPFMNSWKPIYHGKIIQSDKHTTIVGYFDIPRITKIIVLFGFFLIIFALGIIIITIIQDNFEIDSVIFPLFMMIVIAVASRFGVYTGEADKKHIIAFIQDTFEVVN